MTKNDVLARFGRKVHDQRALLGLSQEELAARAGLHRTYVGMIERAEKNLTLRNIEKLAIALEIPLEKLLTLEK